LPTRTKERFTNIHVVLDLRKDRWERWERWDAIFPMLGCSWDLRCKTWIQATLRTGN